MTHEDYFHELMQDIYAEAEAGSQFNEPVFVEKTCEFLCDQAVLEDYNIISYKKSGTREIKVDAWEYLSDSGALTLLISDFHDSLKNITKTDAQKLIKKALRFFEKSLDHKFHSSIDESTAAWGLSRDIYSNQDNITKVRVIILTNNVLSRLFKNLADTTVAGFKCTFDIWDLERVSKIQNSSTGKEAIIINFEEEYGHAIPCLPAFVGANAYQSFLLALPGSQVAELYEKYGERLLEQNVRTFLQFRGKVNNGMKKTILNEPEMFFAYNNGITATAEEVSFSSQGGSTSISQMKNLQIVNGGQTTASLFTSLKKEKADLSNVYVQMKLTVVPPENVESIVPKISEYANTQNKVNAADFFANHPFHLRVEEFSRRIWAPSIEGGIQETKWFYERARGQYANAQANMTPAIKRKFLSQHPRNQMVTKTDLAKFYYSWEKLPHTVSLGAQKNFAKFADVISAEWKRDEARFNELFFKDTISKAILFRHLDKQIMKQAWYESYKANIVTYTIATFSELIYRAERKFDHAKIWKYQGLSEDLLKLLLKIAEEVNQIIQDTPEGITNISEWCKREQCWRNVQEQISVEIDVLSVDFLIGTEEAKGRKKDAAKTQKIDNGIEAQTKVIGIGGLSWSRLWSWSQVNRIFSAKEQSIISLAKGIPRKFPSEAQSSVLLAALDKAVENGFTFD